VFRIIALLILAFVMCGSIKTAAEENPSLNVYVYNDAGVPQSALDQAEQIAQRIYQKAGVAILWNDCSRASSQTREGCFHSQGVTAFSVRIVARSLNLPGEDFGIAFVGSNGVGQQADVFYSGIERLERESSIGAARILGHVMAHELGHLLLGMNSHSGFGIMQAHWAGSQLRQVSLGTLAFDKRQQEIIRARLFGPYAAFRSGDLRSGD
jgi:hypothetical protein